jgi:hypothetical protein
MKSHIVSVITCLFLLLTVAGCVKEDNLNPEIDNTSWKRVYNEDWESLSFAGNKVNHKFYVNGSFSEYTADYNTGCEDGRHYYWWTSNGINYRIFSFGEQNLVVAFNNAPIEIAWIGSPEGYKLFLRE